MHKRIKEIIYQFTRDFDINKLTDEERVKYAQSIINSLISSDVIDSEMPSNILGVDINWGYGGKKDSIIEEVYNSFGAIQDLKKSRNKPIDIKMPKNLKVSYNEFNKSIRLSWSEVSSSIGYRVIRNFNQQNEKTVLNGSVGYSKKDGKIVFIDDVGDDKEHTYIVVALSNDQSESEVQTPKIGKAFWRAEKPTNFKASKNEGKECIYLEWDKMPHATGYTIKRDGSVIVENYKETSYTDVVNDNSKHHYSIKSNGESEISDSNFTKEKIGKGYSLAQVPDDIKVSRNKLLEAIEITWDHSNGAKSYTIERDGKTIVKSTTKTSYVDNVGDDKEHSYRVSANGEVVEANSDYSPEFYGKGYSIAEVPQLSASYDTQELKVVLDWPKVYNAKSYTIKRGDEIIANKITQNSYVDNIKDDKEHYYSIMSEGVVEEANSDYSDKVVGRGYRKLAKPKNVSATSYVLEQAVKITWSGVYEAKSYSVKRGSKIVKTGLSDTQYIDSTGDDESYIYRVLAEGHVSAANSQWSDAVNGRGYVKVPAPKNVAISQGDGFIKISWPDVKRAISYTIKKDGKTLKIQHDTSFYIDEVDDTEEHIYEIKSNGVVGHADSEYSLPVHGRAK